MASTINGTSTGSGGLISTGDDSGILNIQTNETTAITIDASQRAAFVAGTAALPAITTTGDTNTGIFFPSADTIAFAEGGAEAARFDSSGNLGIGTSSPTTKLEVNGNVLKIYDQSTSNANLVVRNSTTGNAAGFNLQQDGVNTLFYNSSNGYMAFATNATERARIDSSGNLLVGTTSAVNNASTFSKNTSGGNTFLTVNSAGTNPYGMQSRFSGVDPNNTLACYYEAYNSFSSTMRFEVRSNGGIANYSANNVNLSDRREKTNFAPAGSYLNKICAIPVQTFNYIDQNLEEDGGLTLGVIAQDVQAVAPELVMESNWAGRDNEPKMRLSIYQTDLQYALMKCIQEQQALIETLTQRITALEAK